MVTVDEIGDTEVVVFKQEREDSAVSTVVIRGSTSNVMDDIERAVDDGVNTFKSLTRDPRLLPGAAATEMELAQRIAAHGQTMPGLAQYAVKPTELVSNLYAAHSEGQRNAGFDIEGEGCATLDSLEKSILDPYLVKYWALKFATDAACTVLRVDQIIMAKQAGGPKPKENPDWDED